MDGIQRKRGKKKKNAPEVTEQSTFEHEWYHARSAEVEQVPPLNFNAVAYAIAPSTPINPAHRRSYTFVHFDPDTGEYMEEGPKLLTSEMYEALWLETSSNTQHTSSSPSDTVSPFGSLPAPPFGFGSSRSSFGLPRSSFHADLTIPKDDADVLVAAAETAEAEEQVKREIFRQSFDFTDHGSFDPSAPDFWGRMQEAVESVHSHDHHGRRSSFHFVAPMPIVPLTREEKEDNDAPLLLWKLSHEEIEIGHERPSHRDPTAHLKV
jgi:hypothetical protein